MKLGTAFLKDNSPTFEIGWVSAQGFAAQHPQGETAPGSELGESLTALMQTYNPCLAYIHITQVRIQKKRKKRKNAETGVTHTSVVGFPWMNVASRDQLFPGYASMQHIPTRNQVEGGTTLSLTTTPPTDKPYQHTGKPTASSKTCAVCDGSGKMRVCGGCRCRMYCSVVCQKAHWNTHKKECKALQNAVRQAKKDHQI